MFDGFTLEHIDVGEASLRVRHGGSGPAVVLLHGHPRTHTTWHAVAPRLADVFTVVCPDLRGYGKSSKSGPFSKRAVAGDIVALMRALGHQRFGVVGHDRGALVAFRLAMDHPDAVERLVIMDGLPVVEHLDRIDARFAALYWHWFFFAQPEKPERAISADPEAWYGVDAATMGAENHADWLEAVHDPATVHAMVEDYRAGLTVDREHEEADRQAGRRIACPLLTVWSSEDLDEINGDPEEIWRGWADDVSLAVIDSGHHLAEEKPEQVADELAAFLG